MADFGTEVVVLASEVTERAVCGAVITATTLGWGAGVPKGKRVAENEPEDCGDKEIDCILHTNSLCVLGADTSDLEKHESDLHQKHELAITEKPEGVNVVVLWVSSELGIDTSINFSSGTSS
jgi:hypothetical protein